MRPLSCALALPFLLASVASRADEVLIDGIAAQVGGDIVLVSEVLELASPQVEALRSQGAPDRQIAQARADALETMIEWRLIEKMVQQTELFATDPEIDTVIEAIAAENNITMAQLKRNVVGQNMSWDAYRAEIKRELERRKILNALIASRVQIEDGEVEALYAKHFADQPEEGTALHLRQILMVGGEQGDPFSVAEVCAAVRKARSEIRSSREFSEFASRYSVVAPETGGDLGWMHLDELAPYMGELVEGLEAGEVSRVMELPVGCTIVQLVEKREFKPVSLEEATEKLTNQLYEMKLRDEYRAWMEELRENTFIERRGYFAAAADFKKDAEPASDFESGLSGYDMLGGGAAEAPATP